MNIIAVVLVIRTVVEKVVSENGHGVDAEQEHT